MKAGGLTRLLHERNASHAISASAADSSAVEVSARCFAACSRFTLRRAERLTLNKSRLVGARRSPKGGYCTSARAISGLSPTLWRTCRVLAGPTRLQLLDQVQAKPQRTVSELAARTGIKLSRASQELRRLHSRGLLQAVRSGRRVHYRAAPDPHVRSAKPLLEAICFSLRHQPSTAIAEVSRIASGFAHPRRLLIAQALLGHPRTRDELLALTHIPCVSLMRHLRLLRARGLATRAEHAYRLPLDSHPMLRCLGHLIKELPLAGE